MVDVTDILVMFWGGEHGLEIARDVTARERKRWAVFPTACTMEKTLVRCIQTLSSEADVINAAVNRSWRLSDPFL